MTNLESSYLDTRNASLVKEPSASYQKKLSLSSWEEQQNLNYEYSFKLSPEERMAYLKELNDKAFGIKNEKSGLDKKIHFDYPLFINGTKEISGRLKAIGDAEELKKEIKTRTHSNHQP